MKTISNQLPVNETPTSERQRRRRSGRFIARTLLSLGRKMDRALSAEEIARMEEEMESLEHDLKAVEESYGENMLNLTCARGHVKKLLENFP